MKPEPERLKSLSSHWVSVNGWRMHYRVAGTGRRGLVLVHGLTVSGDYLLPTAAELLDDFTVYLPDLPGFGASEKPQQILDVGEMADVLKAWMDAIDLERAYLLGNSLGCQTIAVLAGRYEERVAGTIFVSPVGDREGRNLLRLAARALNDFVREPPSYWLVMIQDFLKAGLKRTLVTLRSLKHWQLETWLPQVKGPALVVAGGRDRIVPKSWFGRVTALLPHGRAVLIPEAGHVSNFTHPVRLAALVRTFVQGHDGTENVSQMEPDSGPRRL